MIRVKILVDICVVNYSPKTMGNAPPPEPHTATLALLEELVRALAKQGNWPI